MASPSAPRVVVIGWHGSAERHLRAIAKVWETLDVEIVPIVPDAWRGMSRRSGWKQIGEELAADLASRDAASTRPLVLHTFSNAGLWTMVAMLDACARLHPGVHARIAAVLVDSAPGFPERVSPRFTAKYAAMAMAPSVLAALGQRPAHRHPLLTPPLALALGLWHLVAPRQVRFMEESQARLLALLGERPLTVLYGDADELVPHRYVEAFIERARRRGPVRVEFFPGSGHVRHLAGHRSRYVQAMRAVLADLARPSIEA
jgi:hypothetical protein